MTDVIERTARELYGDLDEIYPYDQLDPTLKDMFLEQARRLRDAGVLAERAPEQDTLQARIDAINTQIGDYFDAVYGPDHVYRAPETFGTFDQWLHAVAVGNTEAAAKVMGRIIALTAPEPGESR